MRIGVITFWQSQDNYGQLLQCFSLQRKLKDLGHSPYLIRYGFHERSYAQTKVEMLFAKFHLFRIYRDLKESVQACCLKRSKDNRRFDLFRQMHIKQTCRFYNDVSELRNQPPKADAYITGSDQVWAQLVSNKDNLSFFLDFGGKNIRRIAYAPSFAVNSYPPELNDELAKALSRFDSISVREDTGRDICRKVGYDAVKVLDPTMLFDGAFYRKIKRSRKSHEDYAFVYHVNIASPEEIYWDDVLKYNKQQGLALHAAYANPVPNHDMEFLSGALYLYPTISEWLGLIDEAKYVVTSSFHGMVFSVLFHKPFAICLRKKSMFAGNDRITSLLSELGLENQIYSGDNNLKDVLESPIDWAAVDEKLNKLRDHSVMFLSESLKV